MIRNIFLAGLFILICLSVCFAEQGPQAATAVQSDGGTSIWFYIFSAVAVLSIAGAIFVGAAKHTAVFPERINTYFEKIRNGIARSRNRFAGRRIRIHSIVGRDEPESHDVDDKTNEHSGLFKLVDTASNYRGMVNRFRISRMRVLEVSSVPPAPASIPLRPSFDEDLVLAIPVAEDEAEPREFREVAMRVIARFKSSNSVYTLSRIALFGNDAELRKQALYSLAAFDHASAFEPILMCCSASDGDVRTTARAALSKLTIDRTGVWAAIANSGDDIRMGRCARAAVLAGFAAKAFEWSASNNIAKVNEATTIVSLLIRSGEWKHVFEAVRKYRDTKVKTALIHLSAIVNDDRVIPELRRLLKEDKLPIEVLRRVDAAILRFSPRQLEHNHAAAA